jgi:upstream activation factor subunit UAF30
MPKQSKSKTTEVVETTLAVTTHAVDVVPVKTHKAKAPKVKAESVPVVSTDVSVPVVTDVSEVEADATDLTAQSTEFLAKLNQLGAVIAALKTVYRNLEKRWSSELKTAQKSQAKRKRKSGNRAPSGFVKPTKISDELAKFLEKPIGSEMARTDVTREINQYIRKHNLQDKEDGRKINPDAKLQSLLKLKKTDELTYFNLQRYMSPHFSKAVKEATA